MMSLRTFGLFVFLAVVMTSRAEDDFEEPAPPTDADIKNMKIKQLKQFMVDRGLTCKDCFEKGDFQNFVSANRNAKLLSSKRPRKASNDPLDEQWKKVAIEVCEEQKVSEEQCKPFWKVVKGSFEMHSRRVSKQMHREISQITKTSMGVPFADAMTFVFRETLKWVVANNISKQDTIRDKIDTRIKMFVTECASDNPNPSYELLEKVKKGKFAFDEL